MNDITTDNSIMPLKHTRNNKVLTDFSLFNSLQW
jgi:hypothetical protein